MKSVEATIKARDAVVEFFELKFGKKGTSISAMVEIFENNEFLFSFNSAVSAFITTSNGEKVTINHLMGHQKYYSEYKSIFQDFILDKDIFIIEGLNRNKENITIKIKNA